MECELTIPQLKTGEAVTIDWVDSKSALGWSYDPRRKRTPGYLKSMGYVVQSNDECVTITTSMDERGASIDDFSIPVGCIRELSVLEGFGLEGGL